MQVVEQLSASLNVFGGDVEVSADAHRSEYDNEWIATIQLSQLHVGMEMETARKLHAELGRVLSELETR